MLGSTDERNVGGLTCSGSKPSAVVTATIDPPEAPACFKEDQYTSAG